MVEPAVAAGAPVLTFAPSRGLTRRYRPSRAARASLRVETPRERRTLCLIRRLSSLSGYLVRRDHEWLRYLTMLANEPQMRAEMGAKAKEAARGWTIEAGWKLWEQAYSSLL